MSEESRGDQIRRLVAEATRLNILDDLAATLSQPPPPYPQPEEAVTISLSDCTLPSASLSHPPNSLSYTDLAADDEPLESPQSSTASFTSMLASSSNPETSTPSQTQRTVPPPSYDDVVVNSTTPLHPAITSQPVRSVHSTTTQTQQPKPIYQRPVAGIQSRPIMWDNVGCCSMIVITIGTLFCSLLSVVMVAAVITAIYDNLKRVFKS